MKQLITVFLFLSTLQIFSQSYFSSDTFFVTGADLETNNFKQDSTANAIVLYELGNSYIDKSTFNLKFEFKQKLKILNRKGFDQATITIYLYNDDKRKEKIKNISATTTNLVNGNVEKVKLSKNQIFKEKYNNNYTLVKFTMPNIQEGSVITYSYSLESPFIYKYKGWEFQAEIPKLYSEYKTSIPANYEYNIKLVGPLTLLKNDTKRKKDCLFGNGGASADCLNSVYAMENIPAFIEEDYMTTKENYLSRIDYELKIFKGFDGTVKNITKSWETADKELKNDQNIGKQLNKKVSSHLEISDSISTESNLLKRAKGIYKYVQNHFTWNKKYGIFNEVDVKGLAKNKSGNVSEINILLHNLLEEYGIEVKPVLISTRNNGLPTKIYPVISDFNYLIVQAAINNKTYYLDATDDFLSFGELPYRCLNQYGRKLDFKNGSEWVTLEATNLSSIQYRSELSINDNVIIGNLNSKTTGYHAMPLKKSYFGNSQEHLKYFKDKYTNLKITDYSTKEKDKSNDTFIEDFKIEFSPETIGDVFYIDPFIFKFFDENPFKLQERTYPIDFGYKDAYLYSLILNIGDDYEITKIPDSKNIALPNNTGQMIFNTKAEGNAFKLFFKINFNKAIYEPEYYDYLKKFMSSIIDIQNNSLLTIKKK